MAENKYLEMPWSVEDTIENLKILKNNIAIVLSKLNYENLGESDVKEMTYDFDRAIKALEKQIPKKAVDGNFGALLCPCCYAKVGQKITRTLYETRMNYCWNCGARMDWGEE